MRNIVIYVVDFDPNKISTCWTLQNDFLKLLMRLAKNGQKYF